MKKILLTILLSAGITALVPNGAQAQGERPFGPGDRREFYGGPGYDRCQPPPPPPHGRFDDDDRYRPRHRFPLPPFPPFPFFPGR